MPMSTRSTPKIQKFLTPEKPIFPPRRKKVSSAFAPGSRSSPRTPIPFLEKSYGKLRAKRVVRLRTHARSSSFDSSPRVESEKSGGRDSNPRQPAWKAGVLPLNYPRKQLATSTRRRLDGRKATLLSRTRRGSGSQFERTRQPAEARRAAPPAFAHLETGASAGHPPRARHRRAKADGGQGGIRTPEGVSQQIYSLPPLAAWVPAPVKAIGLRQ